MPLGDWVPSSMLWGRKKREPEEYPHRDEEREGGEETDEEEEEEVPGEEGEWRGLLDVSSYRQGKAKRSKKKDQSNDILAQSERVALLASIAQLEQSKSHQTDSHTHPNQYLITLIHLQPRPRTNQSDSRSCRIQGS